jgi:hypothetical protein
MSIHFLNLSANLDQMSHPNSIPCSEWVIASVKNFCSTLILLLIYNLLLLRKKSLIYWRGNFLMLWRIMNRTSLVWNDETKKKNRIIQYKMRQGQKLRNNEQITTVRGLVVVYNLFMLKRLLWLFWSTCNSSITNTNTLHCIAYRPNGDIYRKEWMWLIAKT